MLNQKILRVDLTTHRISVEPVPSHLRRLYLGGEGINARLLWEHFLEVSPQIDPLSQDNVLIVGIGPLGGTPFGTGTKIKFTYKSPAYNIYGDTSSGGGLGAQLRWAGYDHIVITGKAKHPVYLWVNNDSVEVRDAARLWGRSAREADLAIRQELGDDRVETAGIGQAGENLVRVASIIAGGHRAGARGGGGCVFGSKNLKAVAARGTKGIAIHDPTAFFAATNEFLAVRRGRLDSLPPGRRKPGKGAMDRLMRYGTLVLTRRNHETVCNNYRNGQGYGEPDEAADMLDHNWYNNHLGVRALACSPGCAFGCGAWHRIKGDETPAAARYAGEWGTRPEYGAANPFGMACDIRDMPAVAHLTKMCNEYGMDTMEIGMSISLLMELWQRGILTAEDTYELVGEPLSLEWGNYLAAEKIIQAVALRKNKLGDLLRGGVYQAALRLSELKGVDVLKYASYGKGGATHEAAVRTWMSMGVACALSSIGAHHTRGLGVTPGASVMYLGKPDAGEALTTTFKGTGHALSEITYAIANSLAVCLHLFGRDPDVVPVEMLARALEAATGLGLTTQDLLKAAERVVNIEKAFNSRLGLRREHDTLCHRWLKEPQLEGAAKGMKAELYLESAKDEYYAWRGWDKVTSLQTRLKLEDLDMQDVARVLEGENALA